MSNTEAIAEYRAAKAVADAAKLAQAPNAKALERAATRLRDAIMKENDGLVWRVAKRILGARRSNPANLEEAVQEGRIGLVRAIELFDASRGSAFSTCAALWIRHHVQNCIHHQADFVKQRSACMPPKAAREVTKFRTLHGREPEPSEISFEHKGKVITPTREQWDRWLDATQVVSVEDMGGGDDDSRPSDELVADAKNSPDAVVASAHLNKKLHEAMAALSPRNRQITQAIFVEGKSLDDVAASFGLCKTRVHQLKGSLEDKLRTVLRPPTP